MIRSVTLLGVLAASVPCKSATSNPWATKKWDDATLRAWSETCAGTTLTTKLDLDKLISVTSTYAPDDPRLDQPHCNIVLSKKHRRLHQVTVSVWNTKAVIQPDQVKVDYSKQLGMVVALVPPDVAAVVRSVASGPAQRTAKGPFIIEGGFPRPGRWELKVELAAD